MVADVRDRALDPRLVTTDQRDHPRAVDGPQGMALTAMQHHPHVGTRRADGLVPVEEGVDDAQRMSGNRHIEVGIVDAQPCDGRITSTCVSPARSTAMLAASASDSGTSSKNR